MYSNNSELTKLHFGEFLRAIMASFSKPPLAKLLFLQANGQQTTVSVKPCIWFRGDNLNYQIIAKEGSNYYIFKAKAPTAKPFADISSIEESFHILKSRPYLTSHVITNNRKNPKTQMAYSFG